MNDWSDDIEKLLNDIRINANNFVELSQEQILLLQRIIKIF